MSTRRWGSSTFVGVVVVVVGIVVIKITSITVVARYAEDLLSRGPLR